MSSHVGSPCWLTGWNELKEWLAPASSAVLQACLVPLRIAPRRQRPDRRHLAVDRRSTLREHAGDVQELHREPQRRLRQLVQARDLIAAQRDIERREILLEL